MLNFDIISTIPDRPPRYGVDGFPYVVGLSTAAALLPVAALLLMRRTRRRGLAASVLSVGVAAAVPASLGIRYTAHGKFELRDRVIGAVRWRGDETVVDLPDPAARAAALDEIGRILRPGGTVVVSDLAHVADEYAPHLGRLGLTVRIVERVPRTFPAQRLLVATRQVQ